MKDWHRYLIFGLSLLFLLSGIRHYVATSNERESYYNKLERFKKAFDEQKKEIEEHHAQDSLLTMQLVEVGREKNKTVVNYDARRIYEQLIKNGVELPVYEEFITKKYSWEELDRFHSRMDDFDTYQLEYKGSFNKFLSELYAFKSFDEDFYPYSYDYLF